MKRRYRAFGDNVRCGVLVLAAFIVAMHAAPAQGTPIRFTPTGNANITGFVEFEASVFNGGLQTVSNSSITGLSLTVFGVGFTLADVVASSGTVIDSSAAFPRIVDGNGILASRNTSPLGLRYVLFKPDGFAGTTLDGDAGLGNGTALGFQTFQVKWVATSAVPENQSIVMLGVGIALITPLVVTRARR